jgi:hypothetical protein
MACALNNNVLAPLSNKYLAGLLLLFAFVNNFCVSKRYVLSGL